MGGMIAQEVARKIPQRLDRLVLYGTGPLGSMPERFEPLDVSLDRLQQDGVAKTARRIAATWLLHGDAHPGFEALSRIGAQADGEGGPDRAQRHGHMGRAGEPVASDHCHR